MKKHFSERAVSVILALAVATVFVPVFDAPVLAAENDGPNSMFIAPIDPITDYTGWTAISDRAGLEAITNDLRGKYFLTADIDLSGEEWVPIGADDTDPFTGTFDGQGHVISNMTIIGDVQYAGLFGYTSDVIITNVGIENIQIDVVGSARSYAGGICGYADSDVTISNCCITSGIFSTATIKATASASPSSYSAAGGLCGLVGDTATITNCYNTGIVSANSSSASIAPSSSSSDSHYSYAGGLCGQASGNVIINYCFNTGSVTADSFTKSTYLSSASSDSFYSYVGGLCGFIKGDATINDCCNTGLVAADSFSESSYHGINNSARASSRNSHYSYTGGLCGVVEGVVIINDCRNTGTTVFADSYSQSTHSSYWSSSSDSYYSYAGGLFGRIYCAATIRNCHNSSTVFAESHSESSFYNPDSNLDSSSYAYAGGLCGYIVGETTITNCHSTSSVLTTSRSACNGGLCGYIDSNATISNCYNIGGVYSTFSSSSTSDFASRQTGGLCGRIFGIATISDCFNMGSVSDYYSSTFYSSSILVISSSMAGGICGQVSRTASISNCNNTGEVSSYSYVAFTSPYSYAGGICGYSGADLTIKNCNNTGDISSSSFPSSHNSSCAGGICAYVSSKTAISDCYSSGYLTGASVGGIIGYIYTSEKATIDNCASGNSISIENNVTGDTYIGGMAGFLSTDCEITFAPYCIYFDSSLPIVGGGAGAIIGAENVSVRNTVMKLTEQTYTTYLDKEISVSGIFNSLTLAATPETFKWSCSDPTAVMFGETTISQSNTDFLVSVFVKFNKTGSFTITVETEDGEKSSAALIVLPSVSPDILLGDVNGSNSITITDVTIIYQHVRGKTLLSGDALVAADVDKSGTVSITDVTLVYQYVRGKISSFIR